MKKIIFSFITLFLFQAKVFSFDTYYAGISFHHHQKSLKNPNEFSCLGIILATPFSAKTVVPTVREFLNLYQSNSAIASHIDMILDISENELYFYIMQKYFDSRQDVTCIKLEDFFEVSRVQLTYHSFESYKQDLENKMLQGDLLQIKSGKVFNEAEFILKKNLSPFALLYNDWRDHQINYFDLYQVKDVNHYFYLVQKFLIFYKYVRHKHPIKNLDKEFFLELKKEGIFDEDSNDNRLNIYQDYPLLLKKIDEYAKNHETKNKIKINLGHIKRVLQFKYLASQYSRNYKKIDLNLEKYDYPILKKAFYHKDFETKLKEKRHTNNLMVNEIKKHYFEGLKQYKNNIDDFWEEEELFRKNQATFQTPKAIKAVGQLYKQYDQYFTEALASKIMHYITLPTLKMLMPMDSKRRMVYKDGHTINGIVSIALLAFDVPGFYDFGISNAIFNLISPINEFVFSISESYTFREKKRDALIRGSIRYVLSVMHNFIPIISSVNQLLQGVNDLRVGLQFNQKLKRVLGKNQRTQKYSNAMLGDPMILLIARERLMYLQKGLIVQGLHLYRNIDLPENIRKKLRFTLNKLLDEERYLLKVLYQAKLEYELLLFKGKISDTLLPDAVFFLFNEYNYQKFNDRPELDEYHLVNELEKTLKRN